MAVGKSWVDDCVELRMGGSKQARGEWEPSREVRGKSSFGVRE